ncbi:MAG TPA: flagellin [Candidatus Gastranaerophilales bacterium]|nr:flagellin [Candidatus Gastranaerophilales bacterium]
MGFEINDIGSSILLDSLAIASKEVEASLVKISHGKQTSAMENAANLMISEEMETQRRGSLQAIENAQNGMNMLSTAESGLSSVNDNLQKIRELAVQRENGTLNENDRAAIDSEIDALADEIDRVSQSTAYNKITLLDGSNDDITLQIGANSEEETNSVNISDSLGSVSSNNLKADKNNPDFLDKIDNALSGINSKRATIGAMSNRLESAVNSLFVQNHNITASQSRIIDVDIAAEVSKLTQNQILQQASTSLFAQANQSASFAMSLL